MRRRKLKWGGGPGLLATAGSPGNPSSHRLRRCDGPRRSRRNGTYQAQSPACVGTRAAASDCDRNASLRFARLRRDGLGTGDAAAERIVARRGAIGIGDLGLVLIQMACDGVNT
ncbi:hypothetical protein [Lysobacter gummosus]|uniref:hypothetical protein n=1 Tax=Lysobacter gummosus TaxID=262324 RepID=UPI00363EAB96